MWDRSLRRSDLMSNSHVSREVATRPRRRGFNAWRYDLQCRRLESGRA